MELPFQYWLYWPLLMYVGWSFRSLNIETFGVNWPLTESFCPSTIDIDLGHAQPQFRLGFIQHRLDSQELLRFQTDAATKVGDGATATTGQPPPSPWQLKKHIFE